MSSGDGEALVVVVCDVGAPLCQGAAPAPAEQVAQARAAVDAARALMEPAGLWSGAPVVVLDAPLGRSAAHSVQDAASIGLHAYAGRPAILFNGAVAGWADVDVVIHELTHVWMRSRGNNPPRWRREGDHVSDESALLHEGLADFVVAALTGDPTVGEGLGAPAAARLVRVSATCPGDLTGAPHVDAAVVSGALWELGGAGDAPADLRAVLDAVAAIGPAHTDRVEAWVDQMTARLTANTPRLAPRWARLVESRGLRGCDDAITVDIPGAAALGRELVAAGTRRVDTASPEVTGPLRFRRHLDGEALVRVTGSGGRAGLGLRWRFDDGDQRPLTQGTTAIARSPTWRVEVAAPPRARTLDFAIVSTRAEDTTFELESVSSIGARRAPTPTAPASSSGCVAGFAGDLLPTLCAGLVLARRLRRCPHNNHKTA